jgi:hypothetical protein
MFPLPVSMHVDLTPANDGRLPRTMEPIDMAFGQRRVVLVHRWRA